MPALDAGIFFVAMAVSSTLLSGQVLKQKVTLVVLACEAGEDRGPLRNAMGKVRALGRQSALIYPIRLRCATQDGPLSSPAAQEKTPAVRLNSEPPWRQSVIKANKFYLGELLSKPLNEQKCIKHGHDERGKCVTRNFSSTGNR